MLYNVTGYILMLLQNFFIKFNNGDLINSYYLIFWYKPYCYKLSQPCIICYYLYLTLFKIYLFISFLLYLISVMIYRKYYESFIEFQFFRFTYLSDTIFKKI